MNERISQGDILNISKIRTPVLVVSKDFFNHTGMIIGCPVYENGTADTLHLHIQGKNIEGFVHCEKMKLLDMNNRGYNKKDRVSMPDIMEVTDAIQSIFDYI